MPVIILRESRVAGLLQWLTKLCIMAPPLRKLRCDLFVRPVARTTSSSSPQGAGPAVTDGPTAAPTQGEAKDPEQSSRRPFSTSALSAGALDHRLRQWMSQSFAVSGELYTLINIYWFQLFAWPAFKEAFAVCFTTCYTGLVSSFQVHMPASL